MQELGDVEQNDETALEFANTGDVTGVAVGEHGAGRFDFGKRNLEHFRSGVDDEADEFVFQLDDQNAVLFVRLDFGLAETLAKVDHRDDFSAEVNHAFDSVLSVGDGSDFGNADDFTNGADAHSERFVPDTKTNDLQFLFHSAVSRASGTNQFRVCQFARIAVGTAATAGGVLALGL